MIVTVRTAHFPSYNISRASENVGFKNCIDIFDDMFSPYYRTSVNCSELKSQGAGKASSILTKKSHLPIKSSFTKDSIRSTLQEISSVMRLHQERFEKCEKSQLKPVVRH